ncbi:MAG: hypothetical protein KDA96_16815, partial [Planctomycetaceae bacterium]|nr:hypothetical protein [Planctomycetaceae bacterium]
GSGSAASIHTNGGNITFGGGGSVGVEAGYANAVSDLSIDSILHGIGLDNATVDAGGGDVVFRGSGSLLTEITAGVLLLDSVVRTTGSGIIDLLGDTSSVDAPVTGGVVLLNSTVETDAGSLTLQGRASELAVGDADSVVVENSLVQSTSGSILLDGLNTAAANADFYISDSEIGKGSLASSGSDIVLRSDRFYFAGPLVSDTTGTVVIESHNDSFSSDLILSEFTLGPDISGLTVGKSTNTASILFDTPVTIGGNVTAMGGDIVVQGNIDTSAVVGGDVLLKALGSVIQQDGAAISTLGGDVTFWADSDGSGAGAIKIGNTWDGGESITTGGGNITLGGGSDIATGYATAVSDVLPSGFVPQGENFGVGLFGSTLDAHGGNIVVRGHGGTLNTDSTGYRQMYSTVKTSGSGTIDILGDGSTVTGDQSSGLRIYSSSIIETQDGAISLTGIANGSAVIPMGMYFGNGANEIRSTSGNITLDDATVFSTPGAYSYFGDLYLGKGSLSASTSNIVLRSDRIYGLDTFIDTTGAVTIESHGASFTGYPFLDVFHLSPGISQLTIGKTTNTSLVDLRSSNGIDPAVRISGDVTVYGGLVRMKGDVSSDNGNILIDTSAGNGLSIDGDAPGVVLETGVLSALNDGSSITLIGEQISSMDSSSTFARFLDLRGLNSNVMEGDIHSDEVIVRDARLTTALTNIANEIGKFAASNIGSIDLVNATGLAIGTVDGVNGIDATNPTGGLNDNHIDIRTLGGDLTIEQSIQTIDTSAEAVVLNAGASEAAGTATGGNIILWSLSGPPIGGQELQATPGISPMITTGDGGSVTLYTGSILDSLGIVDLIGLGTNRFRYNSDETTTNYSLALSAGMNAIYREQPTVSVTTDDAAMTYGDADPAWDYTVIGDLNGDDLAYVVNGLTTSVGGDLSSSGNYVAGEHALTPSGGTSPLGYGINTDIPGTLTVNAKALTYTGTAIDKVYDGSQAATLNNSATGIISDDEVTISAIGTFADRNVNTNINVAITDISLTGADSANYSIASEGTSAADITRRSVTVEGIVAHDRMYDGTTDATLDESGLTFNGLVDGDDLTATGTVGMFDNRNVGTHKTVTLSGTTYGGADADNYSITDQSLTTAEITPRAATLSGVLAMDKQFDGTTVAHLDSSGMQLNGLMAGDDVTLAAISGEFLDELPGIDKPVRLLDSLYAGNDLSNYAITDQASATASILIGPGLTPHGALQSFVEVQTFDLFIRRPVLPEEQDPRTRIWWKNWRRWLVGQFGFTSQGPLMPGNINERDGEVFIE